MRTRARGRSHFVTALGAESVPSPLKVIEVGRRSGLVRFIMRTYEEIIEEIAEIPKFTTKHPLAHTKAFLERLGNPQNQFKVIHVAGSNGKGSVCACIASVLRKSGKCTGLFISPHLVDIEERFVIDGKQCAREDFVQAVEIVQSVVKQMEQEGIPHPSYFEYLFAVGMVIFQKKNVEYAVLETGLGGRLDATNVIEHPLLTVITSISLEHTEILGDTIEKIAAEKAGILKPGVPIVYDASNEKAAEVIKQRAEQLNCKRFPVYPEKIKILLNTGKKIDFSYESRYDVTEVQIPFGAPYQARNAAVALMAANCLQETENISNEAIREGMCKVQWKGRMQEAQEDIYFDGAHNADGIQCFLQAVKEISKEPAILLFSMVQEKDYNKAIRELLTDGKWEKIFVTTISDARGIPAKKLKQVFEQEALATNQNIQITEIDYVEKAFAEAVKAKKKGQKLFCAGSLYLIGELEQLTGGMKDA